MNDAWKGSLEESSELESYRKIITDDEFEKYLHWVKYRKHKFALTKLRITVHDLDIETGRYNR